jgi:hypothetical protein
MNLYDQGYFISPIKHKIKISGSFAELRPNHFHMGIDLKSSKGSSGDPVYAVADGYISRIKIQSAGYGNSLYIDHPNGYTSVYAHLSAFDDSIAAYVKSMQYQSQSFELDMDIDPGQFQFKQGEYIGKMGNSGSSTGPHLHFEIRETSSEIPINPFLFGIKPGDSKNPDLRRIRIYNLSPGTKIIESADYTLLARSEDSKRIKGDTLTIPAWQIGVGIEAFDYMDGTSNRNGLYNLEMKVDDEPVYAFTMEKVSFEETRYINAHIDYKERKVSKRYFQKCFVQDGNKLSIYNNRGKTAIISLDDHKAKKVSIRATDVEDNETLVEFYVKRESEIEELPSNTYNYYLKYNEPNIIIQNALELSFPENCLYEDLELFLSASEKSDPKLESKTYYIHNDKVPVHSPYTLRMPLPEIADSLLQKLCIVVQKGKTYTSYGGTIINNRLEAPIRQFGPAGIFLDDTPPTIKKSLFQRDMRGKRYMSFIIDDNIKTSGSAKGLRYNGWIDDEWVLLEYDAKNKKLKHYFKKSLGPGKHIFRLELIDDRNNKKEFISEFIK